MINEQTQKVILVVEDELSLLTILTDKFMSEGYRVIQARDGVEGLSIAERSHPDIILLDIVMPKMDGLTMMGKLRHASDWGSGVPIILLTNLSIEEGSSKVDISPSDLTYYLVKSNWSLNTLVKKVKKRLVIS